MRSHLPFQLHFKCFDVIHTIVLYNGVLSRLLHADARNIITVHQNKSSDWT